MGCILLCDGFFHHWVFLYLYFLSRWRRKKRWRVEGFFLFFFFPFPFGVIVRDLHRKYRVNAMQVKSSDLYGLCQWTRKLHSLSKGESTFILIAWCAISVELSSLILYKYFLCTFGGFFLLLNKSGFCQDYLMSRLKDLGTLCFSVLLFPCHIVHWSLFCIQWRKIFELPDW